MDDGHVIPEEITALLERRSTFQDWLSKLGELGTDFRPEVAEKVRADYEGRLAEVEGELAGHRTELENALSGRQSAVLEATERYDARAAEMEESELRYRVGEFDDGEWERRRSEHQSVLDELQAELTSQRAAVESLETVLGELIGPGTAVAAAASTVIDKPVDLEVEPVDVEEEPVEAHDEVLVEPVIEPPVEADEAPDEEWTSEPFEADEAPVEVEAELEVEIEDEAEVEAEDEEAEDVEASADIAEAEVEEELAEEETAEGPSDESAQAPDAETTETGEPAEFMDELEFLESLSLDDSESFDAVSAMLDDEAQGNGEEGSERKPEDT